MSRIWILAGALALASATAVAGDAKSRVKSGDAAPDFTLKTLDGKERNLAFFRGDKKDKIVVVDFWSHACPWSRAWDGELSKIAKDFASKNVVVVAIDSNKPDKVEDIQKYAKDKSLAFEVFVDADAKVADAFGGQTTPDIFVIGADG
ncbi:MAG TPA: redoxin domain-containing protein, partial [Planctomycetota bacterium]|nr:redoxin domain-containing protein [Planctomycetota bacterium]